MKSKTFIPTLPMVGEETTWQSIVHIIKKQLLPQLDALGDRLFLTNPQPPPKGMTVAPVEGIAPFPINPILPSLVYQVAGRGQMLINGQLAEIPTGQGMVLPPDTQIISHAAVEGKILQGDRLWFEVSPLSVTIHRCQITPTVHSTSIYYFLRNSEVTRVFQEWVEETNDPERRDPIICKGLLLAFFGLIVRSAVLPIETEKFLPKNLDQLPPSLKTALGIIHRAYNRPLQLSLLSRWCYVSPYHLCRLFQKHLGTTPLAYLIRLRMLMAHHLLQGTDSPVAEVAYLVGYKSLPTFTRLFRRTFGVSPAGIRGRVNKRP